MSMEIVRYYAKDELPGALKAGWYTTLGGIWYPEAFETREAAEAAAREFAD